MKNKIVFKILAWVPYLSTFGYLMYISSQLINVDVTLSDERIEFMFLVALYGAFLVLSADLRRYFNYRISLMEGNHDE